MKTYKNIVPLIFAFVIFFATFTSGCVTPDADNTSARPWNEPRGYDTGIIGRNPRRGF